MTKLTPTSIFQPDITKMLAEFKLPGVNIDVMVAAQKKNIEALSEANQVVIAGARAVLKRQAEILQVSMEQARAIASDIMVPGSPEAKIAKQAELVQTAFQAALANMKELAEMVTKSNTDAANVINKRVRESIEEVKSAIAKTSKL